MRQLTARDASEAQQYDHIPISPSPLGQFALTPPTSEDPASAIDIEPCSISAG